MRKIQGISNDRGYTELRIWLGPKRNLDGTINKSYRKLFGPWCKANIIRAVEHRDKVRKDFYAGKLPKPIPKPILFSQACEIYYLRHWEKRPGRSPKSVRNIKSMLEGFKAYWPGKALHTFKPYDIEKYREHRAQLKIGVGTINHAQSILSSVFERLDEYVKREEIDPVLLPDFNPCAYVKKANTDHLKRERVATRKELVNVHAWASKHDPELLEAIKRAIISGLRKEDMRKAQGSAKIKTLTGKTKRLVMLPLDWTKPVDLSNWQKRWQRLRDGCHMEDFHWHDWRHTGATMLKELGVAEEIIQEILAHTNIQQTRDYINRKEERLRPALELLQRTLEEIMPSAAVA